MKTGKLLFIVMLTISIFSVRGQGNVAFGDKVVGKANQGVALKGRELSKNQGGSDIVLWHLLEHMKTKLSKVTNGRKRILSLKSIVGLRSSSWAMSGSEKAKDTTRYMGPGLVENYTRFRDVLCYAAVLAKVEDVRKRYNSLAAMTSLWKNTENGDDEDRGIAYSKLEKELEEMTEILCKRMKSLVPGIDEPVDVPPRPVGRFGQPPRRRLDALGVQGGDVLRSDGRRRREFSRTTYTFGEGHPIEFSYSSIKDGVLRIKGKVDLVESDSVTKEWEFGGCCRLNSSGQMELLATMENGLFSGNNIGSGEFVLLELDVSCGSVSGTAAYSNHPIFESAQKMMSIGPDAKLHRRTIKKNNDDGGPVLGGVDVMNMPRLNPL